MLKQPQEWPRPCSNHQSKRNCPCAYSSTMALMRLGALNAWHSISGVWVGSGIRDLFCRTAHHVFRTVSCWRLRRVPKRWRQQCPLSWFARAGSAAFCVVFPWLQVLRDGSTRACAVISVARTLRLSRVPAGNTFLGTNGRLTSKRQHATQQDYIQCKCERSHTHPGHLSSP